MPKLLKVLMVSAGLALGSGALAADDRAAMSRDAYAAEKDRIEAQYRAERQKCNSLAGNAEDICQAEAKGREKVARAELEARMKNTERARHDARLARVDADYEVAKERCDDLSGNRKDVCMKEAQAARTKGRADAKVAQAERGAAPAAEARRDATQEARRDAAEDKREADYRVARERCDALSGDAKDRCLRDARARFGQG